MDAVILGLALADADDDGEGEGLSAGLMTPHRPHLLPLVTRFLKPQTWHPQD